MKNLFSKKMISPGTRMYATWDGRQRFYGKDDYYFISYPIRIFSDTVTVVGAYSWATIDTLGETIQSGFCTENAVEINTSNRRVRDLLVCGLTSKLSSIMALDAPKSETGDNPPYIDYDDGSSGGSTPSSIGIQVAMGLNFNYDEASNSYAITQFQPEIKSIDAMAPAITIYVSDIDRIQAGSSIDLFGTKFSIQHVNGDPLENNIESVPNVLPFLCNRETFTARMLYSYNATIQTGLGVEDIYMDVGNEPFEGV